MRPELENGTQETAVARKEFWMVVLDGGSSPTARHQTLADAKAEAARLAVKHGARAWVLHSVENCAPVANVVWS